MRKLNVMRGDCNLVAASVPGWSLERDVGLSAIFGKLHERVRLERISWRISSRLHEVKIRTRSTKTSDKSVNSGHHVHWIFCICSSGSVQFSAVSLCNLVRTSPRSRDKEAKVPWTEDPGKSWMVDCITPFARTCISVTPTPRSGVSRNSENQTSCNNTLCNCQSM